MNICDSCYEVAEINGVEQEDIPMVMQELGSDWEDHLCDQIETDGEILCICSCHPQRRKDIRKSEYAGEPPSSGINNLPQ